ncbi:hypothetical protein NKI38_04290 [Mesorhizobium sp. M0621]|uniref:hypothetical protein n=1 Tax=Mesorhizobium sp. M0621 TaxID=2956974 RepID=UPI00333C5882
MKEYSISISRRNDTNLENPYRDGSYVAVFVLESGFDKSILNSYFKKATSYPLKFIAIWGSDAHKAEDYVDGLIEELMGADIVTTSHVGDSSDELASFIVNATIVGEDNFNCIVYSSDNSTRAESLIANIRTI